MHVALIANTAWLDENLAAFRYSVVGLIAEQVRVVQVVPDQLDDQETSGFCERVTWRDSSWPLVRKYRLCRVANKLNGLGVDLIHALDGRVWAGAAWLARHLETPLILGASSSMDPPLVDHQRWLKGLNPAFIASTDPLAQAIRERVDPQEMPVEAVPQGVHIPEQPRKVYQGEKGALCAVISGNGKYDQQYEALLLALGSIVERYPQAQFFLDGQGSDQHRLWQAASRYGLLPHMSLVPRRLGHRELLLKADVLIHPQSLGRSRALTLGAMAHGVPVMALHDPWLDYLIDQETAWVVERAEPKLWTELLISLIETPSLGYELADRARRWVRQSHTAAAQVEHTLALYKQVTGESIKFPQL